MNDWWKAPVLQGPENDYGQYDYMIEELPEDHAKWEVTSYKRRCDSCGKESHIVFYSVHHFYTLDGWDSMDYADCWKCRVKAKLWSIKHKIKMKLKAVKYTIEFCKTSKDKYSLENLRKYYNLAQQICK